MTPEINVLIITADQWRADCLSVLGHPTVETPHLDALAADGVLFRRHYAQCTPCGPSRASLHTGMYLMNHRSVRNGTPLDGRFTNIALEARKAGYDPSLIGYTDTSADPRRHHPNDPALRTYGGVLPGYKQLVPGSESEIAWLRHLAAKGYAVPERTFDIYYPSRAKPGMGDRGPTFRPTRYKAEDSDTAFVADRALDFLRVEGKRPWFLHLSFLRPHPPFFAPEPYNALYDPDQVPGYRRAESPAEEARQHPYLAFLLRHFRARDDFDARRYPQREPAMRQLRATYYGMIAEVDHHLGRLFAWLKEQGLYERTLIVFTTDHGEQLWDHWLLGKEAYFEQSFHIPLIVRAPGRRFDRGRGRQVAAFTESIDVTPTALELIGLDSPMQCDGTSLARFLRGSRPGSWRQEAHWEQDFRDVAVGAPETELGIGLDECTLSVIRGERYKYIHFTALPPLLFDLQADPDELTDLSGDPGHRDALLECAQKMLSWRMAHGERSLTGVQLTPQGPIERPRASRRLGRAARNGRRRAHAAKNSHA